MQAFRAGWFGQAPKGIWVEGRTLAWLDASVAVADILGGLGNPVRTPEPLAVQEELLGNLAFLGRPAPLAWLGNLALLLLLMVDS